MDRTDAGVLLLCIVVFVALIAGPIYAVVHQELSHPPKFSIGSHVVIVGGYGVEGVVTRVGAYSNVGRWYTIRYQDKVGAFHTDDFLEVDLELVAERAEKEECSK